jgi:hypothetical protein
MRWAASVAPLFPWELKEAAREGGKLLIAEISFVGRAVPSGLAKAPLEIRVFRPIPILTGQFLIIVERAINFAL